jgi:hypothetical protein
MVFSSSKPLSKEVSNPVYSPPQSVILDLSN